MGRGNVCVDNPYEDLFYIDNDDFHVYHRGDPCAEYTETRLMRDLNCEELTEGDWQFDYLATEEEERSILECFMESFMQMFPSFEPVDTKHQWLSNRQRAILESDIFYIAVEDNEWSLAVELLQKEAPWLEDYEQMQKWQYKRYLNGIQKCLLNLLPSVGIYCGAWTHGVIS